MTIVSAKIHDALTRMSQVPAYKPMKEPDAIDRIVDRANAAGEGICRSMIESAMNATKEFAVSVQQWAVGMESLSSSYVRLRYKRRFASRLLSRRRFKSKRLRKKYGQKD